MSRLTLRPLRLLRLANPVVRALLGSPVHPILSGRLAVLTYRARRSGREHRIPLQYARTPEGAFVTLAMRPERKQWWRTFGDPTDASLLVAGAGSAVNGRLLDGEERRAALRVYLARSPRAAGALGLRAEPDDAALDAAPAAVVAFELR